MKRNATFTSRLSLVAGIGMILAGVVLLGVAVKELWWTNVTASRAAEALRVTVYNQWGLASGTAEAQPKFLAPLFSPHSTDPVIAMAEQSVASPDTTGAPTSSIAPLDVLPTEDPSAAEFEATVASQDAFALLYVPRLRDNVWATPILHGVDDAQLDVGVGHFPTAPLPGELGNFSLAGHRMTHGKPFTDIDKLAPGDEVIVETKDSYFVYTLKVDRIVNPTDVWVLDDQPVSEISGTNKGIITLVTCTPKWSTKQRWVWWGELTSVHPRGNPPAALL